MAYYQSTFLGYPALSGGNYVYVASAGLSSVVFKAQPAETLGSTATEVATGIYQWQVPDLSAPYKLYVNGNVVSNWGGSTGRFVVSNDMATITYVEDAIARRVDRAGDTLLGPYWLTYSPTGAGMDVISMTGSNVSASSVPTKGYVDLRTAAATSIPYYLPLSGGTLNGTVTFNSGIWNYVATKINGQAATADLNKITVSGLTSNYRGVHVKSNMSLGVNGDFLSVYYTDTNPDPWTPFRVGADPSTELPYIVLDGSISSNQFTTTTPTENAIFDATTDYYGTDSRKMLSKPDKWIEIKETGGVSYLVPAYLKP